MVAGSTRSLTLDERKPARTMTPQDFITRWDGANGSERANYPLFISDLCELLQVEKPQPGLLAALEAVARAQRHPDGKYSAA
jgi:hypothetical protein